MGEPGWPCRFWATTIPPLDLQPLEPEGQHSTRIVPPRDTHLTDNCVAGAAAASDAYRSIDVTGEGRISVVTQDCRQHVFEDAPRPHGRYLYATATQSAVSPDHSAAGWLALFKECASCREDGAQPFELVVLHDGKTQRIIAGNGMPIWFWMFREGGKQVAFKQGFDDPEILRYELWDVAANKRLAEYVPKFDKDFRPTGPKPPKWTRDLDAAESGR